MAFFCVMYWKEECDGCGGCERNRWEAGWEGET